MECAYCNKEIGQEDIPPESFFVTCPHCKALNNRPLGDPPVGENRQGTAVTAGVESQAPRSESVKLPTVTSLEKKRGRLRLAWAWNRGGDKFLFLAITVIWYILVLSIFGHTLNSETMGTVLPILVPLLLLGYLPLAQFLNMTVIEANRNNLWLFYEPLFWPGRKVFQSDEVSQIYCKEDPKRKAGSGSARVPTYTVNAILKNGTDLVLIAWIESPEKARLIESSIEEQLGIRDRPVEGELSK